MTFFIKFIVVVFGLVIGAIGYFVAMLGSANATPWESNLVSLFTLASIIFTPKAFINLCSHKYEYLYKILTMLKVGLILDFIFLVTIALAFLLNWEKKYSVSFDFYIFISYLSLWQAVTLLTFFTHRRSEY